MRYRSTAVAVVRPFLPAAMIVVLISVAGALASAVGVARCRWLHAASVTEACEAGRHVEVGLVPMTWIVAVLMLLVVWVSSILSARREDVERERSSGQLSKPQ